MNIETNKFVNTAGLQDYLNMSRQAIFKHREKGLPFVRMGERAIIYNLDDVDRYFNSKK
ncbi:MAG: hypothetical protein KBT36_03765 [Kurthia sp.]|nr:hypothetical protein [Candidatus Kurthia equi]